MSTQRSEREITRLGKLDKCSVRLTVTSDVHDAEEIGNALELIPSDVVRIGDVVVETKHHKVEAESTFWTLRAAAGSPRCYGLESKVEWLLRQLFGKLPAIRRLQLEGAEFKISAHIEAWSRLQYFELSLDQLQQLAQLRIRFECVVHYQNTDAEY